MAQADAPIVMHGRHRRPSFPSTTHRPISAVTLGRWTGPLISSDDLISHGNSSGPSHSERRRSLRRSGRTRADQICPTNSLFGLATAPESLPFVSVCIFALALPAHTPPLRLSVGAVAHGSFAMLRWPLRSPRWQRRRRRRTVLAFFFFFFFLSVPSYQICSPNCLFFHPLS